MTVGQDAESLDSERGSPRWNAVIFNVNNYICVKTFAVRRVYLETLLF